VRADGYIQEIVIWRLPRRTKERQHGLKYRLYYGLADGTCIIRYDNEKGKGDHRHIGDKEEPYKFKGLSQLLDDFLADVKKSRGNKT
jgi:hypothetical protein